MRGVSLSLLRLLLISFTICRSLPDDGCSDGEDNVRSARYMWRCGDTCIAAGDRCDCGGDSFLSDEGRWCCHTGACSTKWFTTFCPGTSLPLTTACNGTCNHYPQDEHRDWNRERRSHVLCQDGDQCVQERETCGGQAKCRDGSDLLWCKQDHRRWEGCPEGYLAHRCNHTLGLPGQCFYRKKRHDGKYHCLDRSDEDPFEKVSRVKLDLTLLQPCLHHDGLKGLTCSGKCRDYGRWCLSSSWFVVPCQELGGLLSNVPELCENHTFWSQHPCPEGGTRCQGRNSGECVWGDTQCQDMSNVFRPVIEGEPCESEEMQCRREGEMVCLHPELRCDMHPQCDLGEDEWDCEHVYRYRQYIKKSANYKCESPHHHIGSDTPSVTIWATRCNGREECYLGEDEWDCDTSWIVYIAIGTLPPLLTILSRMVFLLLKYLSGRDEEEPFAIPLGRPEYGSILNMLTENNTESLQQYLKVNMTKEVSIKYINLAMVQLQNLELPRDQRRRVNKCFCSTLEIVLKTRADALIWMKQHINPWACRRILGDECHAGLFGQLSDSTENLATTLKTLIKKIKNLFPFNHSSTDQSSKPNKKWATMGSFVLVCVSYLDLIKDFTLISTLIYLLQETLFTHFTSFSSQLTWLLIASVILPLLISAQETSRHRPLIILGYNFWQYCTHQPLETWRLWRIKILTVVMYPMVPAVLISAKEEAQLRMKELLKQGRKQFHRKKEMNSEEDGREELHHVMEYLNEVRRGLLTFKRNEFGVEMVLQLTVQTVMLLLSKTITPTHSGLEAVFKEEVDTSGWLGDVKRKFDKIGVDFTQLFLSLSILWSFKTSALTYIKIKTEEKIDFMPVTAKIVLALRALLASITRIGCMVAFFCPVLGLLSMMAHWKAEQTSLDPKFLAPQVSLDPIFRHNSKTPDFNTNLDIMTHGFSYWNLNTNSQVNLAYSFIYRSDYSDPENPVPPEYKVYTGVTLQEAYAIFWALISVQYISILTIKMRLSDQFRAASWKLRLLHIVETINLPDWFSDWDVGEGSQEKHKKRYRAVLREMMAVMIVHFFSNLVMLLPIILTGLRIHERHMTILPAIGVYREEEDAFLLVSWLSWFLPMALVIFSFIDIALIWAYIKFFHPWREILQCKEIDQVNERMCGEEQQTEETVQTETEEGKTSLVVMYRCTSTSLATSRNSYHL